MRAVITDLETLDRELPTWYGIDFAVDLETTGLSYIHDRILGVALTFADDRTYYIVLEHTVPSEERVTKTRVVSVPTGEIEEYEHTTPSGKVRIKQRPVFEDVEETYDEVETTYPTVCFIDREQAIRRLRPLFAQTDVVQVAHNAKFELHFLNRAGAPLRGRLADTMVAAQLIDENRSVGLKELCHLVDMQLDEYTKLEHYPGFKKEEILGVPLDLTASYAQDDTEATWKLWQRFKLELDEEGVAQAFTDISMPLLVVLQEMEARGIALDMERVNAARAVYQAKSDEAELAVWHEGMNMLLDRLKSEEWQDALGSTYLKPVHELGLEIDAETQTIEYRGITLPVLRKETKAFRPRVPWFKPSSTDQLGELLFGHYELKPPRDVQLNRNSKGGISVDRDTLTVLRYELDDNAPQVLTDILNFRKADKMLSTYFDTYAEQSDPTDHHCIRTSFHQAVTDTGRLSSSNPNLQNQPSRREEGKLIRDMFVARPGYKLVVADYSMMELRMAAHYSGDEVMMQAFTEGLDLHTLTAERQSGIPYAELKERIAAGDVAAKLARDIGKTSNFGLLYGMGAKKFQRYIIVENDIKVSIEEAQALIDGFNETFLGVTEWKKKVVRWAKKLGYVETIAGRKRRLPDLFHEERWLMQRAERQGINCVIQGSCADIISEVMPPVQAALKSLGGSLLLQVHDELVGEVPEAKAEVAARVMEQLMVGMINPRLRCPLVADAHIGESWGSAKAG